MSHISLNRVLTQTQVEGEVFLVGGRL